MRRVGLRYFSAIAFSVVVGLGAPAPQASQTAAFEVASIKVAAEPDRGPMVCIVPCTPGERYTVGHGRLDARYVSVERLILTAYRIKRHQLSGPGWMESQRFDIQAKLPEGAPAERVPEMLQSLLAERFKLSIHRARKDLPVYALVIGKDGPKLTPATEKASLPAESPGSRPLYTGDGEARMTASGGAEITSGPLGPVRLDPPGGESHSMEFLAITMAGLADALAPHQDRPTIDATGIAGRYRIVVPFELPRFDGEGGRGGRKASSQSDGPGGPPIDPIGDGLRIAIEKAGLRLEKRTAAVETIVVDRIEKVPTAN